MTGQYQYIDLLAANMEITLMPGQYIGFASTSTAIVAYKYSYLHLKNMNNPCFNPSRPRHPTPYPNF